MDKENSPTNITTQSESMPGDLRGQQLDNNKMVKKSKTVLKIIGYSIITTH
jgi:hypothetical protein